MTALTSLSATELAHGYRKRLFTPLDVVDALQTRFQEVEPHIHAFATPLFASARAAAVECAKALSRNEFKPLLGIPVAIKDLIDTAGIPTSYGSRIFADHVPQSNAHVVEKLIGAGAILIGKSATHEFAWGFTTDNPHFGPTRNPWDTSRIPGGSSGGSAAALAAHCTPLAIGTDTGGSIRLPSAYCGLAGLKPTHGSLCVDGIFPLAPSLDHVGPMARSPQDLDLCMGALKSDYAPVNFETMQGVTIAIPDAAAYAHLPEDIADAWDGAVAVLQKHGATIRTFSNPVMLDCAEIFTAIMVKESAQTHIERGLYPALLAEYGEDIQARFALAEKISDQALAAAKSDRDTLRKSFQTVFEAADLVLTICSSAPPLPIATSDEVASEHYASLRDTVLRHTAPQNLTGLPAAAFRAGFDRLGLPVGCQFTAPANQDALAVAAARLFHSATPDIQQPWPEFH